MSSAYLRRPVWVQGRAWDNRYFVRARSRFRGCRPRYPCQHGQDDGAEHSEEQTQRERAYVHAAQAAAREQSGAGIDVVDVFRASEHVAAIVDDVIRLGIPYLWLQDGVMDAEAVARARAAGSRRWSVWPARGRASAAAQACSSPPVV